MTRNLHDPIAAVPRATRSGTRPTAPRRSTRRLRFGSAALVVAALAVVGCAPEPPPPTVPPSSLQEQLQAAVDQARGEQIAPGAIVLVESPDGTFTLTSGTVGEGSTVAPGEDDRTRIGSLTKTMTATILLQLVEDGLLELDDLVSEHLDPAFLAGLPYAATVTLRDLAHMTSGIAPYSLSDAFQAQLFADPSAVWTPEQLVDFARPLPAWAPLDTTGWQYSNTNYILLGMVIEQVTQAPLAQVFHDRLFGPLGMTDSSFPEPAVDTMAAPFLSGVTAQGQPEGTTTDATKWNPSEAWAAGGVVSTLADLAKWGHALFTGEGVLDPATQQLRRDSILHSPPPLSAASGYGIGIGESHGWWGHDGQIPGYTSSLQHDYGTDTTVIVLTNSDVAPPGGSPARAISEAVREVLA
jgi:D-alanyl-D-alanine carboxypeptidase